MVDVKPDTSTRAPGAKTLMSTQISPSPRAGKIMSSFHILNRHKLI